MGKFYNATITTNNKNQRVLSICEFFNNIDGVTVEFVSETDPYVYSDKSFVGAKIRIDNSNIEVFFGIDIAEIKRMVVYIAKTTSNSISYYYYGPDVYNYGSDLTNIELTAYSGEGCILLAGVFVRIIGFEVLYVDTTDDKHLIGYSTSRIDMNTAPYVVDINSLMYEDENDSARIPYTYTNMFPYTAIAGTIDFTNEAFFVNGTSYKSFITESLKECSTVTLLSTQSLPSSNCIALGAHCLAPLDEE